MVKMRFLVGIARAHRRDQRHHQLPAGEGDARRRSRRRTPMVDALVHAMEVKGRDAAAIFRSRRHTLYAAQVLTQQLYAQVDHDAARPGGRRPDHAAVVASRTSPIRDSRELIGRRSNRRSRRRGPGEILQARLGRSRLGIRVAPHAIRNVLCRRDLRDQGPQLPHFRLGPLHAARRSMLDSYSLEDEVANEKPGSGLRCPMPIRKEHKEFHAVDMAGEGWHSPPGYPRGYRAEDSCWRSRRDQQDGQPHATASLQPGAYTRSRSCTIIGKRSI